MAGFGDNIQEFLLKVRAEGRGEIDALTQAMDAHKAKIREVSDEMGAGNKTVSAAMKEIAGLSREIASFGKALNALDPEFARYQAHLEKMAERSASEKTSDFIKNADAQVAGTKTVIATVEGQIAAERRLSDEQAARAAEEMARLSAEISARNRAADIREDIAQRQVEQERANSEQEMALISAEISARNRAADIREDIAQQESERENARLSAEISARNRAADIKEDIAQQERASQMSRMEAYDRYMKDALAKEDVAIKARTASYRAMHPELQKAAEGSKQFSYGMLHIAHAMQDAQYGFGAVLNNIPLVVQALGGGPGLAGTIMMVGVAAEVLKPHMREIGVSLGILEDVAGRAAHTLDQMKDKLEAMTSRPWKTAVDFSEIRKLEEAITLVEQRIAAAKAADKPRSLQEASGKLIQEALIEKAGGTDQLTGEANLLKLMKEGHVRAGDWFEQHPEFKKLKDMEQAFNKAQARLADPSSGIGTQMIAAGQLAVAGNSMIKLRDRMDRDLMKWLRESTVGSAARGEEAGINRLIEQALGNKDLFGQGIPGVATPVHPGFVLGLQHALPANIREQERLQIDQTAILELRKSQAEQEKENANFEAERLKLEQKTAVRAFEANEKIKARMGIQFEEKPLEPFRRAVSPWERQQQALGRARRQFGEGKQLFRDRQLMGQQEIMNRVANDRPDLNEQQLRQLAPVIQKLMRTNDPITATMKAIVQMNMQVVIGQQKLANELNEVRAGVHAVQSKTKKLQQRRPTLFNAFPFQTR